MSIENVNIKNLTTTTFSTVRASFAGIGIYSGIQSINADTYKKKLTNGIASLILIIAFFHYDKMNKLYEENDSEDNKKLILVRYSDWIVTVPLLIFELFLLMDWIKVDDDGNFSTKNIKLLYSTIALSIFMLISGYIGETSTSNGNCSRIYFTFSCLCLVGIFGIIYKLYMDNNDKENERRLWIILFFAIWVAYAFGFGAKLLYNKNPKWTNLIYNITDLFSKGMFAFLTTTLVTE